MHLEYSLKNKLEPKKDDWFFLYILPAFFLGMSGYSLYMLEFDLIALIMAIPFTLMALGFHFKQKGNLKVVALNEPGTSKNFQICLNAAKSQEWEILDCTENLVIVAETKRTWRSWGELVTITFSENNIFINSRPSPYKKSSVATWGKNKININIIRSALCCS
jgi:hypothetical protein